MRRLTSLRLRLLAALTLPLLLVGVPSRTSADSGLVILGGFPTLKQHHPLTCESSAASMGTKGVLPESQIMAVLPRNPNPNYGFRGNPDGEQGTLLVDYGVYAAPIQRALLRFGYESRLIMYGTRYDIKTSISRGWPVVAWITYQLQPSTPRLATANGAPFVLVPHEHAVLLIGYDNNTVVGNDPWTGSQVRYYWWQFERSWKLFGNMALSMAPCPAPLPVTSVKVVGMDATGLTWSWKSARNAAQYDVKVIKHGAADKVVFHGLQLDHRFTLTTPTAGVSYEIVIRSISPCGGTSAPYKLWVLLPSALSTPTPTVPESTVIPTSTPTATPPATTATPAATPGSR